MVKDSIEFLERLKHCELGIKIDNLEEAINFLKRGEKYEEMWKEVSRKYGYYLVGVKDKELSGSCRIETFMNNVKQKYFLKPIPKTITIEIEGEDEDISKFTDSLSRVMGQINFGVRTKMGVKDEH